MCLGIPGEILSIEVDEQQMRKAKVRFGGITRDAYLDLVPDAAVGDYVIVHVGFAISQLDEEEALKTLELLRMIDEEGMAMELGAMAGEPAVGAEAPPPAPGAAPAPGARV